MQEAIANFTINRSIDVVFDFLTDLERMGWCIAGVKEVRVLDKIHSEWKVEVRAGIISQSVRLEVTLSDVRSQNHIAFAGKGRNVDLSGTLELSPLNGQTMVSFRAIIIAKGPLGPLIDLVMGHTAANLTKQSVEKIKSAVEGASPT